MQGTRQRLWLLRGARRLLYFHLKLVLAKLISTGGGSLAGAPGHCGFEGVELAVNLVQELQVLSHGLRLRLRTLEILEEREFVLLADALVLGANLGLLHVAGLQLATHLLDSLLRVRLEFFKAPVFFFFRFPLLDLSARGVHLADVLDLERYALGGQFLQETVDDSLLILPLSLERIGLIGIEIGLSTARNHDAGVAC